MTSGPPFPPAAVEYIRIHCEESRSVLAFEIGRLFGYPCTKEGVKGVIRRLKRREVPNGTVQTKAKAPA